MAVSEHTAYNDNGEILRNSISELDELLDKNSVVGDPITVNEKTVIPLLSTGFGFGGGTGEGNARDGGKPMGAGAAGAGGGIKPVAVVIMDENGTRLERVAPEPASSKLGTVLEKAVDQGSKMMGSKMGQGQQGGGQQGGGQKSKQGGGQGGKSGSQSGSSSQSGSKSGSQGGGSSQGTDVRVS